MMRKLVVALSVLACGCATVENGLRTVETGAAQVMITPDQESSLGLQVKNDLEQNQHVRYVTDPAVVGYVRGVADKVIAFGRQKRPEVSWQVNVIDDPKTVNAFATPGGYLYVYTGLLLTAENEAELAGVMAHETGHVVARHSARQLVAQHGLDAVAKLALGKNPGLAGQLASSLVGKGTMLAHSRADETEADELGARYASQAGYDPHGLVSFFNKLKAQEGGSSKLLSYLSDHPATADRITHVSQFVTRQGLRGTDLGANRFLPIKQRLASSVASSSAPATSTPRPSTGHAPPN